MSHLPPDPHDDDKLPPDYDNDGFEQYVAWVILGAVCFVCAAAAVLAFHILASLFKP